LAGIGQRPYRTQEAAMARQSKTIRPGQKVPTSGQYKNPSGKEITLIKGKPAPPTRKPGQKFTLVDKTKHRG
jgi:hypothetical protein